MAIFRRRRRFTRRPFRRRSFGGRKPFARQTFDKIELFNNLDARHDGDCAPLEVLGCKAQDGTCGTTCTTASHPTPDLPCQCCENTVNFNLINNSTLESFYQDRITIMRMYGDLWFRVTPPYPALQECEYNIARTWQVLFEQVWRYQYNLSIRKVLVSQREDTALPQFDGASPAYGYDWTESSPPWIWQRVGMWMPRPSSNNWVLNQQSAIGVCSDTSGGGGILVSGSGTIDPVSTNCDVHLVPNEGCPQIFSGTNVLTPPWHHYRIRTKRHIVMARDQALNLTLVQRFVAPTSGSASWACTDWSALPTPLDTLVGGSVIQAYCRIGATIRYN